MRPNDVNGASSRIDATILRKMLRCPVMKHGVSAPRIRHLIASGLARPLESVGRTYYVPTDAGRALAEKPDLPLPRVHKRKIDY